MNPKKFIIILLTLCGVAAAQAQPQKYWTGDGGSGIRIAVLVPEGKGLSAEEQWLLSMAQSSITGDFNKFSAMTITERQNLEKIFSEWEKATSGNYSEADRVKIGNLTNANHILTGAISKTADAFMIEFSVMEIESGKRKASYSPTLVSPLAMRSLSAVKAVSADLLKQLGVELTDAAIEELNQAANTARIEAEKMLARGIEAQKQGTEVEALSYFFQAAALDPSLLEAATRSSVMAADISSGNIGKNIRGDIEWRKNWVARLKETEETFYKMINSGDPPYTLFYSTNIETGKINYKKETANLSIAINLNANKVWFDAMGRAFQAVLDGLNSTNRKHDWELARWPKKGVSNTNPFASSSSKKYDIKVAFELVNEKKLVIGSQTARLSPVIKIAYKNNDRLTISFLENIPNVVIFNGVKADDISDNLTIRIASVNGKAPQEARFSISGTMSPLTERPSSFVDANSKIYKDAEKGKTYKDPRDGNIYKTVKIGDKTWMAQNLNYQPRESLCYDNEAFNCNKYGRLYRWDAAETACPTDWHLPSRDEWNNLVKAAKGSSRAGKVLKTTAGWTGSNGNGTDYYGFSALPGGYYNSDGYYNTDGYFDKIGNSGYWWTATNYGKDYAYYIFMDYDRDSVFEDSNGKSYFFSVRCVQGADEERRAKQKESEEELRAKQREREEERATERRRKIATAAAQTPKQSVAVYMTGEAMIVILTIKEIEADPDKAIAEYTKALRKEPNVDEYYRLRGAAYYFKKDYDGAIADYNQALRLNPKDGKIYNNRGNAYVSKKDYDRAIADYNQAIRLDPNLANAYNNRGVAYKNKGDNDRAIADYDQAIRLDPNLAIAYNNRGVAYINKGDNDRAIADYDQAIRLNPKNAETYVYRGIAYNIKGDYDRGIAGFNQAIRLNPKNAETYFYRGLTYADGKKDYDRAIADFNSALRINPNYLDVHEWLERAKSARRR